MTMTFGNYLCPIFSLISIEGRVGLLAYRLKNSFSSYRGRTKTHSYSLMSGPLCSNMDSRHKQAHTVLMMPPVFSRPSGKENGLYSQRGESKIEILSTPDKLAQG